MKDYFLNDYPSLQLSKYFMKFLDKICNKLDFFVYYEPHQSKFIVSDVMLGDSYKYYKTLKQIKEEKPSVIFYNDNYNWTKKGIILFNKEEPYEQNDGEYYYPDHYECNHDIDFKMSTPNIQKLLLCIFKNPILKDYNYLIKEIFNEFTFNQTIYFPSENLSIDEKLDLLLVKNLEQRHLLEAMCKEEGYQTILTILQKKSEDYLVEFFKCFGVRKDLKFKDFIFKVTNNQNTLSKIFENFPEFQKYLSSNTPEQYLKHNTEQISIYKSFFDVENLSIKYHDKFNSSELRNCLSNILENSSLKESLESKSIIIHSSFYSYSHNSLISIIENKSILSIEKIEQFFCDSIEYIQKTKKNNYMEDNKDNVIKFFNYFYQNELSLKNEVHYTKKTLSKI